MANIPLDADIPEPLRYAAELKSAAEGITPLEWIERNFSYNPDAAQQGEEIFRALQDRLAVRTSKAA